jgi:hypothetical protein
LSHRQKLASRKRDFSGVAENSIVSERKRVLDQLKRNFVWDFFESTPIVRKKDATASALPLCIIILGRRRDMFPVAH